MIHYYTNREIAGRLGINLARWKRWSRSFLPPDPLGGMQSGYTRQYLFKDLFKVFLGGHLLSHLKLTVPESQQVLADLTPWLKKNGFFHWNGSGGAESEKAAQTWGYRIYFSEWSPVGARDGSGFRYLIRKTVGIESGSSKLRHRTVETFDEALIPADLPDARLFFQDPCLRMINLGALFGALVQTLRRQPR